MTTIMGIWQGNKAWLAGDYRVTGGENHLYPSAERKIIRREIIGKDRVREVGMGLSGSHIACQLARQAFDAAPMADDALHVSMSMLSNIQTHPDKTLTTYGIMLWSGKMYDVDTKGAVTRIEENVVWARGSGEDYAMGAAEALRNYVANIPILLDLAFKAVTKFDLHTGGGLQVEEFDIGD